ncbi:SDR family NAD(P)-dependent oxidoreductase [Halomonas heilongjiangensis]|uniref:Short-chain dehydrogenase n=1 Tax=Halomonas heilongjiangensis TaxID=1387883 RepID=A0A2N7TRC8_9GAMM|nr:SDR family NAD(P)-dependent oxidoreductase [Halomonas heilongjiangensis]PMR70742.1 short-chain dehydrogenase [Halomonas heilongjiangensis]PXX93961.1 short-chain dehydrogenase [Halomonas heilongjiangensis]
MARSRTVLITGATGAIGSALAREYAAPGTRLVLHGRRREVLAPLADACRARGARIELCDIDLTDDRQLGDWLDELAERQLPDVVIANAGQNTHVGAAGELEPWPETSDLLAINLRTPLAMAHRLAPPMVRRGSGQLVFISSLAAWHGLPLTPAYSASKAGLKAYGEGLRGHLAPHGVGVSVVMPGYVRSAMCDAMPGPKPWLWSPERAARAIRRGVTRNRARIAFPLLLHHGCWWLAVLPAAVSQRLLRLLGFGRGQP